MFRLEYRSAQTPAYGATKIAGRLFKINAPPNAEAEVDPMSLNKERIAIRLNQSPKREMNSAA